MMRSMLKTLESFDGRERVLISRRPDGPYTHLAKAATQLKLA
jgi:hypothetical protein